jgi:hypothetical protein
VRASAFLLAGLVALAAIASACASGASSSTQPRGSMAGANTTPAKTAGKKAHRLSTGLHKPKRHHHRKRPRVVVHRPAGVPRVDVPNAALTPGAAFAVGTARICVSGYASSVRDVPESEKDAVYARYGIPHVSYQHEVDHLVSLEIGGSNAISNLWPEPYAGRWGARTKDVLEDRLHDLVCSGTIGLRYAQHIEARNWVAAYKRYVGSPPVATSSGSGGSGNSGVVSPGSGGGGNCTPGYSPCLPYRAGADYDCYGGNGNGPYFTAPGVTYAVSGSDPYRLDGNGDGEACG